MRLEIHVDEIDKYVGREFVSSWRHIDQDVINRFAAVTGDEHWVHVDIPRAEAFRGHTIAHGLLTLCLFPVLWYQLYQFVGASTQLNYGLDKVRFTGVVPSGSKVRLRMAIMGAEKRPKGRVVTQSLSFDCWGNDKTGLCRHIVDCALQRGPALRSASASPRPTGGNILTEHIQTVETGQIKTRPSFFAIDAMILMARFRMPTATKIKGAALLSSV